MPRYIMKADKEHNLFVEWSTVVDAPVQWGPREDFGHIDPDRLDRAEETGTSMHPNTIGGKPYHEGSWDDDGMIVHNLGNRHGFYWLERAKLYDFIEALTHAPGRDGEQAALDAHTKDITDDEE